MARNKAYTKEQINEAMSLLKSGDLTQREVAKLTGLNPAGISYWAVRHGLSKRSKRNVPTVELHDLDAELEATKAKLAELQAKRERLSIRFESSHEGNVTMVSVWGITDDPITAPLAAWVRFLKNDGVVRLREFLDGLQHKA